MLPACIQLDGRGRAAMGRSAIGRRDDCISMRVITLCAAQLFTWSGVRLNAAVVSAIFELLAHLN